MGIYKFKKSLDVKKAIIYHYKIESIIQKLEEADLKETEEIEYNKFGEKGDVTHSFPGKEYVIKELHDYDERGNLIETSLKGANGDTISKMSFEYNDENRIIKQIHYNKDGNVVQMKGWVYENNKLITEFEEDANETVNLIKEIKYNEVGEKMELVEYDNGNIKRVSQNIYSLGKLRYVNVFSSNGDFRYKRAYYYNSEDELKEQCYYRPNGDLLEKRTYKNGNLESISKFFGKNMGNIGFTYDLNGNPISKSQFLMQEDIIIKYVYEYKYDDYQNWISKITKKNSRIIEYYRREIMYN